MSVVADSLNAVPATARVRSGAAQDAWPHTQRLVPWALAVFMVMLYWIPFESVTVPITLPINSDLDRFVLVFLIASWLVIGLARGESRWKRAPMNVAIYAFVAMLVVSIVFNLRSLRWNGELKLSLNQLSLVFSYLGLFYAAATTVRREEVEAFIKFLVILAVGTALGTIYEYRSNSNVFFTLAHAVLKGLIVGHPPSVHFVGVRAAIVGPTLHGLADATLMAAAVPFAFAFATRRNATRPFWWGLCVVVLFAGCVATQRKTAMIVPIISLLVMVAYEPRRYVRYWPGVLVVVLVIVVALPHALTGLLYQFGSANSSSSTASRTSAITSVMPYIVDHLLIGRGYASFDPRKYIILDDQMLGWVIETGVLGFLAYAGLMLGASVTAHRGARRPEDDFGSLLMRGVVAFSVGFFVSNFLYDTFGFRQAPYVFFLVAALGVAYTASHRKDAALVPAVAAPAEGENGRVDAASMAALEAPTVHQPAFDVAWVDAPTVEVRVLDGLEADWQDTAAPLPENGAEPAPEVIPEPVRVAAEHVDVSILVVTYRNPELTRNSLRSIISAAQGTEHEILVLDNASGDGTAEMIAAEFPEVDLEASQVNLGFARANNALARKARGRYVLLLNPDTIVPDGTVQALVHFAETNPGGGIYGGRTLSPSGKVDPSSCWGAPSLWSLTCFATGLSKAFSRSEAFDPESLGRWKRDSVREVGIVTGCLALVSRPVWEELGGFDERFWLYGEDADLSMRAREHGYRPMITPAATITHVVGASSAPGKKNVLVLGAKAELLRKHWPWWRAWLGIGLLVTGAWLRATVTRSPGWTEAWERRGEWTRRLPRPEA